MLITFVGIELSIGSFSSSKTQIQFQRTHQAHSTSVYLDSTRAIGLGDAET